MQKHVLQREIKIIFTTISLFFFLGSSILASESYELVTKWGKTGTGDGEFDTPYAIATDNEGNVYVADFQNCRIQKFTPNGEFITKWGRDGSGDGQLRGPSGISIDKEGSIYVVDDYNFRIQKFTLEGEFITKWGSHGIEDGQFYIPISVATDTEGNVYVVDMGNPVYSYEPCIKKFNSEGVFITKWGSSILTGGHFVVPWAIVIDSEGYVYVSDPMPGWIHKFTLEGEFLTRWGSLGKLDDQLLLPAGVATDNEGNVYVSDNMNHLVKKFTSDGEFITKWGSEGPESGQFGFPFAPFGICTDSEGHVYVTDRENDTIKKFVKVSATTTTTTTICPSEIALHSHPHEIQLLREFRNEVLRNTTRGQRYIDLYYQHAPEVSSLLLADERLKTKTAEVLTDLLPLIESILGDEDVVLSKEFISEIELLLDEIGSKANPKLRAEINKVKKEIREEDISRYLGICIYK